jgi:hypothetical protein
MQTRPDRQRQINWQVWVLADRDRMTDVYELTGRGNTTGLLSLANKGSVSVRIELSGKDSMTSRYITFFIYIHVSKLFYKRSSYFVD